MGSKDMMMMRCVIHKDIDEWWPSEALCSSHLSPSTQKLIFHINWEEEAL